LLGDFMTPKKLKRIAEQVLGGKELHEVDFGEPSAASGLCVPFDDFWSSLDATAATCLAPFS
jgi:hypothetical protein